MLGASSGSVVLFHSDTSSDAAAKKWSIESSSCVMTSIECDDVESFGVHEATAELLARRAGSASARLDHRHRSTLFEVFVDESDQLVEHRSGISTRRLHRGDELGGRSLVAEERSHDPSI